MNTPQNGAKRRFLNYLGWETILALYIFSHSMYHQRGLRSLSVYEMSFVKRESNLFLFLCSCFLFNF